VLGYNVQKTNIGYKIKQYCRSFGQTADSVFLFLSSMQLQ